MANYGYDEIWYALEEAIKLQAHYAELINMHDGGQRIPFKSAKEFLDRLRKLSNKKG
jgi:hypothetical protein